MQGIRPHSKPPKVPLAQEAARARVARQAGGAGQPNARLQDRPVPKEPQAGIITVTAVKRRVRSTQQHPHHPTAAACRTSVPHHASCGICY